MAADVYSRLTTVEIIKNRSVRRYCEMSRVQEKRHILTNVNNVQGNIFCTKLRFKV